MRLCDHPDCRVGAWGWTCLAYVLEDAVEGGDDLGVIVYEVDREFMVGAEAAQLVDSGSGQLLRAAAVEAPPEEP